MSQSKIANQKHLLISFNVVVKKDGFQIYARIKLISNMISATFLKKELYMCIGNWYKKILIDDRRIAKLFTFYSKYLQNTIICLCLRKCDIYYATTDSDLRVILQSRVCDALESCVAKTEV